jgi:hypothetical protein
MFEGVGLVEVGRDAQSHRPGAPWHLPVDPLADEWWSAELWADEIPPIDDVDAFDEADQVDLPDGADDEPGRPERARWDSPDGLDAVLPGADLARLLERADLEHAADLMLVELVASWERLAAWAHLGAMLAAGELAGRESMNPPWGLPLPSVTNVAGDELAFRLAWSKPAAYRLVRDGIALDRHLNPTADAVRRGAIDTPKLRTVTDRLHDRAGELALAVQEAVLPEAGTRTPSQLAADIDRALLRVYPDDAADRLRRAITQRHVCHPRRLPDGMAGIWAVVPAVQAAQADALLDATARSARALGSPATLDQLRADAYAALLTGQALLAGAAVDGTSRSPTTTPAVRHPATHASEGGGHGAPDDQSSHADADGPDFYEVADPQTGSPGGPTASTRPPIRIPTTRVDIRVDLTTLLGLDDRPGDLAGFGPIPAQQARALALQRGAVWRRLVTDPLSGAVLDVGRSRYRPPAALAEHVAARDQVCAGPGCSVPAHRCDLDHTTEYHGLPANGSTTRGTTSAGNVGPLSDRCHRLKTDGGFTLRQVAPGVFEWRTPAGLAYRVIPGDHGHTERLRAEPPPGGPPRGPNPGYPDEPPF